LDRLGYRRQIVRSSAEVGENLLPLANRVASLLKRWLLGTHQGAVSATHLDYYLDEYTFRFNRRTSGSRGLLFLADAASRRSRPRPCQRNPRRSAAHGINQLT
jgi:ISXO2-like transposase domain